MLMNPNEGETAVHGGHCPGDMVVRMRTVLAIRECWYACFNAYFVLFMMTVVALCLLFEVYGLVSSQPLYI